MKVYLVKLDWSTEDSNDITYKGEDLIWNENVKKHIPKDWQVYCLGELFSFVKGKIPTQLKDKYEDVALISLICSPCCVS